MSRGLLKASLLLAALWLTLFLPMQAAADRHIPAPRFGMTDKRLDLFVEYNTSNHTGYLEPDAFEASLNGPDRFVVYETSADALEASQETIRGEAPTHSVTITTRDALTQPYFLNLSQPVKGTFYWSSTLSRTSGRDLPRVRIELFAGETRVGGTESFLEFTHEWDQIPINFRSEVAQLEAGTRLALRVTLLSGLSDFSIGTAPPYQSVLTLSYFDQDPLATRLFVEGGKLRVATHPPNQTAPPPSSNLPPQLALTLLVPFGLLALQRAPQRRVFVIFFLLLAMAVSGCLGGGPPRPLSVPTNPSETLEPIEPEAPVFQEILYEPRRDLQVDNVGFLSGVTTDWLGFSIQGVNISLGGTSQSILTNEQGYYEFQNLTGGSLPVYYDHPDYLFTHKDEVLIKAGYVAWLNVTLVHPPEAPLEHSHDVYGSAKERILYEDTQGFLPVGSNIQTDAANGKWTCQSANWVGGYHLGTNGNCTFPLAFKSDHGFFHVPPGTARVSIKLSWDTSNGAPPQLGLYVSTNANSSRYIFRGPNEPFNIAIFPHEADPGHQMHSSWTLLAYPPPNAAAGSKTNAASTAVVGPALWTGGKITFEVLGYKGVVPYEAKHRAFWKGATELPLIPNNKKVEVSYTHIQDLPSPQKRWDLDQYIINKAAVLVPPGTKEIRGTFSWTYGTGHTDLPTDAQWRLLYKGADLPPESLELREPEMTQAGDHAYGFRILLDGIFPDSGVDRAQQTDQFYQLKSNWKFYVTEPSAPLYGGMNYYTDQANMPGVEFYLNATAVRDPASAVA